MLLYEVGSLVCNWFHVIVVVGHVLVSFSKKLPNDISHIAPNMLSQRGGEEHVLHQFHRRQPTTRTILINPHRNMSKPFIRSYRLVNNISKEACNLLSLVLMPNGIPT